MDEEIGQMEEDGRELSMDGTGKKKSSQKIVGAVGDIADRPITQVHFLFKMGNFFWVKKFHKGFGDGG